MYTESLAWAEKVINDSKELDRIMRSADAFISKNTAMFAEYGDNTLARAFQNMSQVVVDTKNTLRDVQAYGRQIQSRLSDSVEYMGMINVPEGASPSEDDMMILDMVLDSIKDALKYSANTT